MPVRHQPVDDPARSRERYPADAYPYPRDLGADRYGRGDRYGSPDPEPYGDRDRYDSYGYDRYGYDRNGFDRNGYAGGDRNGYADDRSPYALGDRDRYATDDRDRYARVDRDRYTRDDRDRYARDDRDRYARDDRDRGGRDDRDRDDRGGRGRGDGRGKGSRDGGRGGRRPAGAARAGRSGGGTPRGGAVAPSTRIPWLLRGTLVAAAILAVAASVVRAGAGTTDARERQATLVLGSSGTAPLLQTGAPGAAPGAAASPAVVALKQPAAAVGNSPCQVRYTVGGRTSTRFTALLTLVNTGPTPLQDWTLRWKAAAGVRLSDGSNADVSVDQDGALASDVGSGRLIPSGGSTTIGFVGALPAKSASGAGSADPAKPLSAFSLNGVKCR